MTLSPQRHELPLYNHPKERWLKLARDRSGASSDASPVGDDDQRFVSTTTQHEDFIDLQAASEQQPSQGSGLQMSEMRLDSPTAAFTEQRCPSHSPATIAQPQSTTCVDDVLHGVGAAANESSHLEVATNEPTSQRQSRVSLASRPSTQDRGSMSSFADSSRRDSDASVGSHVAQYLTARNSRVDERLARAHDVLELARASPNTKPMRCSFQARRCATIRRTRLRSPTKVVRLQIATHPRTKP